MTDMAGAKGKTVEHKRFLTLVPLVLLALLAAQAHAASWVRVGRAGGNDFYVDKGSITQVDKQKKAWTMQSFKSEQTVRDGPKYMSVKALHLYSCDERTSTLQTQVFYEGGMGKGNIVLNFKYEKYNPEDIVPDSNSENAFKLVCGKN